MFSLTVQYVIYYTDWMLYKVIFYSVQYIFDKTIAFWYHYRHRDIHLCCDLGMTGGDLASVLRNAFLSEQLIYCILLLWCSSKLSTLPGQGAPSLTKLHYLTRDWSHLKSYLLFSLPCHSLTVPWLSTSKCGVLTILQC